MTPTLEKLVTVRSQLAEGLRVYFQSLMRLPDEDAPPYLANQTLTHLYIQPDVLKEERKPDQDSGPKRRMHATSLAEEQQGRFWDDEDKRTRVPWESERSNIKSAVILGRPGEGKTLLARMTVRALAETSFTELNTQKKGVQDVAIPVCVRLADVAEKGLKAAIEESVRNAIDALNPERVNPQFVNLILKTLETNRCWLFLDALDEVPERANLKGALEPLRNANCRVVLTCRTANYDRAQVPWGKLMEYELAPFRPQEIRQFIEQWFGQENEQGEMLLRVLDRNYALSHACCNPLIATLTCLAHEEGDVTQETRRVDLYARVLRGLARRAWKENPLNPQDTHIDDLLRLLELLAWNLFEGKPASNQFTNSEIIEAIRATPDLPLPLILGQQITVNRIPRSFSRLFTRALTLILSRILKGSLNRCLPSMLRDELRDCGILVGSGLSRDGETRFSFLHRTDNCYPRR